MDVCSQHAVMVEKYDALAQKMDVVGRNVQEIHVAIVGDLHEPGLRSKLEARLDTLEEKVADQEYERAARVAFMARTKSMALSKALDWAVKLLVVGAAAKYGWAWLGKV